MAENSHGGCSLLCFTDELTDNLRVSHTYEKGGRLGTCCGSFREKCHGFASAAVGIFVSREANSL